MKKAISILCDGSKKIGAGHFFRCYAIGKEFEKRLWDVIYFLPDSQIIDLAVKSGLKYIVVPGLYDDEKSINTLMEGLNCIQSRYVLVDSHRVNNKLLSSLHDKYFTIYMDDTLSFPYHVDMIINGHVDADQFQYKGLYEKSGTLFPKLLIGPRYFSTHINKVKTLGEYCQDVGFFAGGSDPDHVTLRMLNYLTENAIQLSNKMLIVVGTMNNDYDELKKRARQLPFIELVHGITDLSSVYSRIGVAVTAAGITLYELALNSIPTIVYSMVDNQVHTAKAFEELGVSINIGDSRSDAFFEGLFKGCREIVSDREILSAMRTKAGMLIDGNGAERIANILDNTTREQQEF